MTNKSKRRANFAARQARIAAQAAARMKLAGIERMSDMSWDHKKSSTERGYGREHRRLRAILLAREPLCRLCLKKTKPKTTVATIADHIVSLAKGGAVHDIENLQPVCFDCHQRKTLEEQGKRVKPTFDASGWPIDD